MNIFYTFTFVILIAFNQSYALDNLLGEGEGDCDDSSECKSGLNCVNVKYKEIESYNHKIDGHETCQTEGIQNENYNSYNGEGVKLVGATTAYACGSSTGRGKLKIKVPDGVRQGDFLALFLQRTDAQVYKNERSLKQGGLPLSNDTVDKSWKMEAMCNMKNNGAPCTKDWRHKDLINVFLWKFYDGKRSYSIDMSAHNKKKNDKPRKAINPEWAILVALRNIHQRSPIDGTLVKSRDRSSATVFPALEVIKGGYLLLSQAFDDAAEKSAFKSPRRAKRIAFVTGSKEKYGCKNDETGFLFGREIDSSSKGREYKTKGKGGRGAKDITISVSLRPKN